MSYLGYAIMKEREDIEKRGMTPDREPSRWLQVLGVIQKGVMSELTKGVSEDVEVKFFFLIFFVYFTSFLVSFGCPFFYVPYLFLFLFLSLFFFKSFILFCIWPVETCSALS